MKLDNFSQSMFQSSSKMGVVLKALLEIYLSNCISQKILKNIILVLMKVYLR